MAFRLRTRLGARPTLVAGAVIVALFALDALLAPAIAPHDPLRGELAGRLRPPIWMGGAADDPLGTDSLGRDVLSRLIWGARMSFGLGLVGVAIAAGVGTTLGMVAGWREGWLDGLLGRVADFLLAFPMLIFAIGVITALGPGFWNLILALSLKSWVEFMRLGRGEVLAHKRLAYVDAARALGRSGPGILAWEILPNVFHGVLVLATLRVGYLIIAAASLSFLGLGVQPPTPEWGAIVNDGRNFMLSAWWLSTFPGLAIVVLVLGLNLLGEGLRELLDPRLQDPGVPR
jgi:peptide/nickel transport system permease protein